MTRQIDCYISLNSPWSFMGGLRLTDILARSGATAAIFPVQVPVLLERTGGIALAQRSPERQAYRLRELDRWRLHLDVPLTLKPAHFPTDEALAAGAVICAAAQGDDALGLAVRLGRAIWIEDKNIADPDVVHACAQDVGLDGDALMVAAQDPAIAAAWAANSERAIRAGAFGVPFYVVGEDGFWGQDRLDFVERALA